MTKLTNKHRVIEDDMLECGIVSLNEITEISNQIRKEITKIIKKYEKSHLVKPTGFIQVFIRQHKEILSK